MHRDAGHPHVAITAGHCFTDPEEPRATWLPLLPDDVGVVHVGFDQGSPRLRAKYCEINRAPRVGGSPTGSVNGSDMVLIRLNQRFGSDELVPRKVLTRAPAGAVSAWLTFWTGQEVEVFGYGAGRRRQFARAQILSFLPSSDPNDYVIAAPDDDGDGEPDTPLCAAVSRGTPCFGIEPGDSGGPTLWTDSTGAFGSSGETYLISTHRNASNEETATWWPDDTFGRSAKGPWIASTLDPDGDGRLLGELRVGPPDPTVDSDLDRVPNPGVDLDFADNCPSDANTDQLDTDCDLVGDVCDICPDVHDPLQTDRDGDGIGDACDGCPDDFDDGTDFDRDGIPDVCDTCRTTPSSGNNCNAEAERAVGAVARGDECDPVPCGDTESFTAMPEEGLFRHIGNNHFDVDGLAAGAGRGPGTFGMRFCECPTGRADTEAVRAECEAAFSCVVPETLTDVLANYELPHDDRVLVGWKPIETAPGFAGRSGVLRYAPDDLTTPEDESTFLILEASRHTLAPDPSDPRTTRQTFGLRACAPDGVTCFPDVSGDIDITWMIQRDIDRFRPGTPPPLRAELTGVRWTHVDSRPADCFFGPCAALDRALSSNFSSGPVREQTVRVPFPGLTDPIAPGALPPRACPECGHGFPDPWLVDPCAFDPVLCERPKLFARFPGPTDLDLTASFSDTALAALLNPDLDWIAPAEDPQRLPQDVSFLAALTTDGSAFAERLVAAADGQVVLASKLPPPPPPQEPPGSEPAALFPEPTPGPRTGHGVAFWGSRQRIVLAGGRRLDTGELPRDVWTYRFSNDRWRYVPLATVPGPGPVLAMTVDPRTGTILLFDVMTVELPRGRGHARAGGRRGGHPPRSVERVRLLRIDPDLALVEEVLSVPRLGRHTTFGLAGAPDGAFYLVASHDRAHRWLVLRFTVDDTGVHVLGHASGRGRLLGRPHATGAGVSFLTTSPLTRRHGGPVIEPVGVGVLDLRPPHPSLMHTCF